jgi:hypothetical protein
VAKQRTRDPHAAVTSIRFTPEQHYAIRVAAASQGVNVTELVRDIVGREIARREGKCPTCKQPVTDDMSGRR